MEDSSIVELYWTRSEHAITETASKYGKYCYAIAYNILTNKEDAERAVFIYRYWYLDSIDQISRAFDFSNSKVKSMLHRTRTHLLCYLRQEGVE